MSSGVGSWPMAAGSGDPAPSVALFRGIGRRGGARHGGAERSGDGAGLKRRGAGDPARRAGASGLLRWLSPARSCGFPGSSPRWRPRPRTAPRPGLRRRSAASLSTRTARKPWRLPCREVGDRKSRPRVLSCRQLVAREARAYTPRGPRRDGRRLAQTGSGLGSHLLLFPPLPAGGLDAPNPRCGRRARKGWLTVNGESPRGVGLKKAKE